MCRVVAIVFVVVASSTAVSAQLAVHDAAVTARNSMTAARKELLLALQRQQHSQLRRMAMRLSLHTNLEKYAVRDPPRWRIHDFETPRFAGAYLAALNYGDPSGAAYLAVSHPRLAIENLGHRLTPASHRAIVPRLATVDIADAAAMSAAHDSGQLRFSGRRELAAIEALERHVIDPSNEQSATAVLDKISGAALIGARQRQARIQLLVGVVEQLLVDSKRARDTEAGALTMQMVKWRDGRAANEAFVAGSGDALRTWRQP